MGIAAGSVGITGTGRYVPTEIVKNPDFSKNKFYDLNNDPDELNNVYNSPQNRKLVEELKAKLEILKTEYQVTK